MHTFLIMVHVLVKLLNIFKFINVLSAAPNYTMNGKCRAAMKVFPY